MADAPKKFKGFKPVGKVRSENAPTSDEEMREKIEGDLNRIKDEMSKRGKSLDTDKVKQYMDLFKYAKEKWTPKSQEDAKTEEEKLMASEQYNSATNAMIEGVDVQALIQELKHRAAKSMEKVPEVPDPEIDALLERFMLTGKTTCFPETEEVSSPPVVHPEEPKPGEEEIT